MKKLINLFLTAVSKISFGTIKNYYLLDYKPAYDEDGVATSHNIINNNDLKFINAYNQGFLTQSSYGNHLRWRVNIACKIAKYCTQLSGDFIELGTNRGLMATSIINYNKIERKFFFLVDTYAGRVESMLTKNEKNFRGVPDYKNCYEFVKNNFKEIKYIKIIKGKLPNILKKIKSKKFSFVHVDLNSSIAEILSIKIIWNKIEKGGVILLDDYCYSGYGDTKKAWDKFALETNIEIIALPTGQGLIIKN